VFLISPPDRLDTYARWLRLVIGQALSELARAEWVPRAPFCSCSMNLLPWAACRRSNARWA
jgi:hypothetical protein